MGIHRTRDGWRISADPDHLAQPLWHARHRGEHRQRLLQAWDLLAGAAADIVALALPVECVCCGKEDLALCAGCERRLRMLTRHPSRAETGAPALMDTDGSVILPVVAAGIYREELSQSILAFKRHGQGQLRTVLSKVLASALAAAYVGTDAMVLVPVPSSGSAYRKRGFSPVHLLLVGVRQSFHGPRPEYRDALRKVRNRGTGIGLTGNGLSGGQKGLGRGDRSRRVRGSMRTARGAPGRSLRGRECIIIDDVLTTGATLAEAARAIHEAGGIVRGAVVLAATRAPDAVAGPAQSRHPGGLPGT
ncbi:ComF family protein [Arthrobacter sp. ISL-65]|uniref:ComF family protein n=1 Tax=Arthrobacter sp. ISL-65 TaxID=2819112 RepID=UPI001BE611B6|nr:phosphoribosyltransferase family protein [Arthrobacter sp. ISL-65]MBT2549843.1 ComF family protein [Arthrobacter sp. ISL-65]